MKPPSVIGYHGTSVAAAESILLEGFKRSQNEYDWLGDGVYFFQDAPNRAYQWAKEHYGDECAVVACEIALEDCMDLLDIGWASILADAYDDFLRLCKITNTPLPKQSRGAHRLDRFVINYAIGILESQGIQIRSVRAAFAEGGPVFPNSALRCLAHVQLAVRDESIIKKVRLERPGGA
ncbi:MAG TPA: hypothetical protein VE685_25360 [Thermoanaerobaculia bacterium]|nr:hypothetical protein [Thermoanaerobaculia bacterium]